MVTRTLSRIGNLALDLLYPPRCALCDEPGTFLCDACLASLPRAAGDRCDVCWLPVRSGFCPGCNEHPPAFSSLRSVWRYEGEARKLVHAFKFGGQTSLCRPLAAQLARAYQEHLLEADVLMPVPLTGGRRRTRGYNQAGLLAREVSRVTAVPHSEALRRRGGATPQANSASAEERRRNVVGVFEVSRPAAVEGRRVLLIDDVATTGATLNACATTLLDVGASDVSCLTLARED